MSAVTSTERIEFALALIQMLLQGIVIAQLAEYTSRACAGDRWLGLRGYTIAVALACVAHTVTEVYKAWVFLVDASAWNHHFMRGLEIIFNGFVCTLVQAFFVMRCWKATRSRLVLLYMIILVLGDFVLNLFVGIELRGRYSEIFYDGASFAGSNMKETKVIAPFWVFTPTLLDASITIILIAYFKRSQTGLPPLDAVLRKTSYLALEAALLPAIARILAGIGYIIENHPMLIFCATITGKLYVLAYLRALNVRPGLRQRTHVVRGRQSIDTLSPSWPWGTPATWPASVPTAVSTPPVIAPHEREDDLESACTDEGVECSPERRRSSEATFVGDGDLETGCKPLPPSKLGSIGEDDAHCAEG